MMTRYHHIALLRLLCGSIGQCFVHSLHLPSQQSRTISKSIVNDVRQRDTTNTSGQRLEQSVGDPFFSVLGNRDVRRHQSRNVMALFLSSFPVDPIITSNNNNNDEDTSGDNESNKNNNKPSLTSKLNLLQQENQILRMTIKELETENLTLESQRRIVIENFEGEGNTIQNPWWNSNGGDSTTDGTLLQTAGMAAAMVTGMEECDERDDDGACPLEPDVSFKDALRDRAYWLVGLLALQSMSGFILARNEELLQTHPVIIYFLTMLIGAGGNAGNQASVRGTFIIYMFCDRRSTCYPV